MNKIKILETALEYIEANLSSEIKTDDAGGAQNDTATGNKCA